MPGVRRCIQIRKAAYQNPEKTASAAPRASTAPPIGPAHSQVPATARAIAARRDERGRRRVIAQSIRARKAGQVYSRTSVRLAGMRLRARKNRTDWPAKPTIPQTRRPDTLPGDTRERALRCSRVNSTQPQRMSAPRAKRVARSGRIGRPSASARFPKIDSIE